MTRLMLILSAIAALMLIAAPAIQAGPECGGKKAAAKAEKGKDCGPDCNCPGCKAKAAEAAKAKKDKGCAPDCDCPACKAKKAHAGCDCDHKGSHPECPHAKAKKTK